MRSALLVVLLVVAPVAGQDEKVPDRVGRILIEGNTDTPDRIILRQLDLRPGQILRYAEVEAARGRLARLGLFDTPSIEVLSNELDSTFKDIRIRVRERSWNWIFFATRDGVVGFLTLDRPLVSGAADRLRRKLRGVP